MINLDFKQFWLTMIFLFIFSIEKYRALTICPTAIWQRNATTVAGGKGGASGSTSTKLNFPTDIYIDNNSTIYVLDANNYRVQRILSNSSIVTTVVSSSNGTGLNQFGSMNAMNIDGNGSIYVLDGVNGLVTKWMQGSSSGTIIAGGMGTGNNTNQLNSATGMFIDFSTSIIWIADTNNHRIVKWPSPTTSMVVCGSYGSNNDQFIYPRGLFVDTSNSNTLYVADSGNHRIQLWLPGATTGQTIAGITNYYGNGLNQLWFPNSLIIDNNRNMFIIDTYNSRILQWTIGASSGIIIAGNLTYGTQSTQLYNPYSINFDTSGSLYVADTFNNRIQKFLISCRKVNLYIDLIYCLCFAAAMPNISTTTPSSVTTTTPTSNMSCSMTTSSITIAGSPTGSSGSSSIYLNIPYDVFVDNNSIVYVLDSNNYRVQRFLPNSTIGTTVVSGTSGSALNQFSAMYGFTIDYSGNIYIIDGGNNRVTKWIPGAVTGIIVAGGNGYGSNANQLAAPTEVFIGLNTSIIWVADTDNSRIVRWESPSTGIIVCGSFGSRANQFKYPYGLFVDTSASNTLYVADTNNHRIQMWLSGAINGTTVAGQTSVCGTGLNQLCYPVSVTGDNNGNIYIADNANNRILQWMIGSTSGVIIAGSSTYGTLPNQLNSPGSAKLDPSGAIIVADTNNNRIQKVSVSYMPYMVNTTTTVSSSSTWVTNASATSYSPSMPNTTMISTATTSSTWATNTSSLSNTAILSTTIANSTWATNTSAISYSPSMPNTTMISTATTSSSSATNTSSMSSTAMMPTAATSSIWATNTSATSNSSSMPTAATVSSSSSMIINSSATSTSAGRSTSTMMLTTTRKASAVCINNCPQWLSIILCSILILMND